MSLNGFSSGTVSFFRGFQGWLSLSRYNFKFLDIKKKLYSIHTVIWIVLLAPTIRTHILALGLAVGQ